MRKAAEKRLSLEQVWFPSSLNSLLVTVRHPISTPNFCVSCARTWFFLQKDAVLMETAGATREAAQVCLFSCYRCLVMHECC